MISLWAKAVLEFLKSAWDLISAIGRIIPWWVYFWAFIALAIWAKFHGDRQFTAGQMERQGLWDAATAEQEQRIRDLQAKVDTATAQVEVRTIEKVKTIHEKGDTIIRRIPQLIPAGACDLPVGFRVLHDDASGHEVPVTTASAD